ncbi:MAG: cobalamin-dependent protein, partial [Pseudomonadales bacterium]|nr:cobalamin-dependent protein [Pseudomonadales bacterium]
MEAAKLRAARLLWHKVMAEFAPRDPKSSMLRTHCQTSGVSLQEQDPYNNVVRTTIEALAAVLGGTQSLHTNAFDEAIALPTPFSARIARNTQSIIAEETQITRVVDPLGGSYYLESLTHAMVVEARKLIAEVEAAGGMTHAIEQSIPMRYIEESAARRQARIERGEDVVIGVNKYPVKDDMEIDALDIDNSKVLKNQIRRLQAIRGTRDQAAVEKALSALSAAASDPGKNLLALAVEAARHRATVGEISEALATRWQRYRTTAPIRAGIFNEAYGDDPGYTRVQEEIKLFTELEGRKPGIFLVKIGQDGHDRGAKAISSAFNDTGFAVTLSELFQSPAEAARRAAELDVHVVGVSTLAGAHRTIVPELIEQLKQAGCEDTVVVVGGVIPKRDYQFLYDCGVSGIFGPGTNILDAASSILQMIPGKNR